MPGKTRAENDKRRVTACFAISIRSSWARCAWNIFPEIDYRFSDAEGKNVEACCHECDSTFRLNEIKYQICNSTTRFDINVKYEICSRSFQEFCLHKFWELYLQFIQPFFFEIHFFLVNTSLSLFISGNSHVCIFWHRP